ncbi:thioredoxin-like domain-containing protein [Rubellicoccus peritrichatus]|uniref:Thioredoxin-like domain-containing protein n=1 Tax=Rubellicoccus peritrichatus TaxID=3080537 RepID=A0AAQ3LCE6_9BACT|nr:thioredoxin-like domain-containing protein [Puniceicoccus sp. CR14]WOO40978.1 thioredoxin-like domain-containing protein [Puniceicoccus sp. CR14]
MKKIACLSLIFIINVSVQARVWTDSEGRSMEADFVQTQQTADGTMVVFRKDDGMRYQFPLSKLSAEDQKLIKEGGVKKVEEPTTPKLRDKTSFEEAISSNLVQLDGRRLKGVSSDAMEPKEYYAIYYSAHWCPPCRKFTPKLVNFYKKQKRKHDDFEIIFVSSDRSEEAMEEYMEETSMRWFALDYDKKKRARDLTQFSGKGIPCLVVVDKDGNVLSHSYDGTKYLGPTKVMNDLEDMLSQKSS